MEVAAVLRDLFQLLRDCEIEFMVGGSFASGAWGEPRHTNDIDVTADIRNKAQVENLVSRCGPAFTVNEFEVKSVIDNRAENEAFQILHNEFLFKTDVFLLTDFPFARSAFSRRVVLELLPEVKAPCATAEDVILRKLLWYQLGNRMSDRQWNDVVKVIEVQLDLDHDYLKEWAVALAVSDLLVEAIQEAHAAH